MATKKQLESKQKLKGKARTVAKDKAYVRVRAKVEVKSKDKPKKAVQLKKDKKMLRKDSENLPRPRRATVKKDRDASRILAEKDLARTEKKYRIIADNTHDMEFWINPDGKYLYVSPSCARITGYDKEEYLSDLALGIRMIHPDDIPIFKSHLSEEKKKKAGEIEFRIIRKDGEVRWMSHACQPVFDEDGRFIGSRGSNRDITASKLAEQAIEDAQKKAITEKNRLEAIMKAIPVGIALVDAQGGTIKSNVAFEKVWGSPRPAANSIADYAAFTAWWVDSGEPVKPEEWASARAVRNGETVVGQIMEIERFDGTRAIVHNSAAPIFDADRNITGSAVSIMDITRHIEDELSLKRERDFNKAVLETIGSLVIVLDRKGCIVNFNKTCRDLTGYTLEEVLNIPFWDILLLPEEITPVKAVFSNLFAGQFPNQFENYWVTKDGKRRLITWSNTVISNDKGEVDYVIGTGLDITEQREFEEALRKSEEDLNRAQSVAQIGSWRLNMQKNELLWSDENHRIFGIPKGIVMTYETFLGSVHPDDREYVDQMWSAALRGEPYDIEHRIVVNGEVKWVRELAELEFDKEGMLLGGFGTTQDITEKKQDEESLRKSEERLTSALKAGDVFAFEWNPMTDDVIRSESCAPIIGLPPDESIIDTGREFFQRIHPDDRDKFLALLNSVRPDAPSYETTYRLQRPDGKTVILEETARAQFDNEGHLVRLYGMTADVTERETALALLRKSEQELSIARDELEMKVQERTKEIREKAGLIDSLFKHTITPLVLLDREFNFLRVNKAYADVCMKDVHEFYGHNHFELFPHEENQLIFRRVVETKIPYQVFAKPFVFPDHPEWGTTYWDWTVTPLLDSNGEVNFLIFSLNDVTGRVKAQERIKIERNRLRTILDTMPDGVIIVSKDYEIQYVNPQLERDFGSVEGRKCHEYFHGLREACSWCRSKEVLAGNIVQHEWTYAKTGKIYDLLSAPFINDDGSVSQMKISHDITKRKQAEEAIKFERQRLYSVLEQLPAYVALLAPDYTFSFVNEEFKRRFGDPGNRKCHEYLFGLKEPCEGCQTFRILTERLNSNQWEWTGPDGNTYAIFDYPYTDIDGTAKILEMGLDITERKKAEEYLRLSENRYRLLMEQAADGIILMDINMNTIDVNTAACWITGYAREEMLGMNARALMVSDDIENTLLSLNRAISGETVRENRNLIRKEGHIVTVEASVKMIESDMIQVIFRDITERKERESRIHVTDTLLGLYAKTTSRQEYLESVVQVIHDWSGCRCVGIRVADSRGYIPYESYTGFSQEFWKMENMLSLNKDMCACIRTVTGKYEPQDASVLTSPHGSVYINNSLEFLQGLTEEETARFRGNCIRNGFLSIALIPIRYRDSTTGLIHLADERAGTVPLKVVQFLESVSSLIGEAIHRFNTEEALRKSEARLNKAQGIAHIGNWEWNIDANELSWSDEMYRIFGVSRGQFGATYEAVLDFIHPDDRQAVQEAVTNAFFERKPYAVVHRIIPYGSGEKTVQEQGEIIFDQDEVPLRIVGTIQDVTEQKKKEEELRSSREQLRKLYMNLETIREKEREKIAREVHDEFGTMLTALKIDVSWLEKKLLSQHPDLIERLHKNTEHLSSAIKTVQRISSELRPGILDHLGLAAATEWQVKEFATRMGITWNVDIDMESADVQRDLSISMFRILQESLTNIARHASASDIKVTLMESEGTLHMEITDNGRGITDDQIIDPQSFGLIGIRERVEHMGGEAEIGRAPQGGTTVSIKIPVRQGVIK
jgi:PAS domain S-box-containing protein